MPIQSAQLSAFVFSSVDGWTVPSSDIEVFSELNILVKNIISDSLLNQYGFFCKNVTSSLRVTTRSLIRKNRSLQSSTLSTEFQYFIEGTGPHNINFVDAILNVFEENTSSIFAAHQSVDPSVRSVTITGAAEYTHNPSTYPSTSQVPSISPSSSPTIFVEASIVVVATSAAVSLLE